MEFMESDVRDTIQQQQKKQQEQEQGQQQQQQKHFHVLAVDDSHIDMKLLEKLLRVSSYQVTCVNSGDKALAYLGLLDNIENIESPPSSCSSSPLQQEGLMKVNLIMTDYCMPGINGYDLLKRVKGSTLKDVPVVIMSSENVPSRITMCLEGGAEKFLLKPLQLSDLEKLQPCLLKSLQHNNIENSFSDNKIKENENNYNNNSKGSSDNNSNKNTSKRKAVSPEPSERRPKMKELAVV